MNASHSKSAFLYRQVRRALQSGDYAPGQRLDPTTLAGEFRTSPTPVRFALYRLVGEGLVTDHARAGMHVPLPTEIVLRDRYDWMQRLLLLACDIGFDETEFPGARPQRAAAEGNGDQTRLTWQLFDAIARATDHRSLHRAVQQTNDRLAPVRRAKQGLIDGAPDELAVLQRHWHQRDIPALKSKVVEYHERRKRLVPRIVAMLIEKHDRLH